MSALAAVVTTDAAPPAPDARVRAILAAMPGLGGDSNECLPFSGTGAVGALGVTAHAWEQALRGAPSAVAALGPLACAVDATLFHRADLFRALGSRVRSDASDAELILAAYQAWGIDGFARLEGEFAAVIWDGARGLLVAARDFAGSRMLYQARVGTTLILASTVSGLLADDAVPRDLDLVSIATVAAGLWGHSTGTAYRAIAEVPAGQALVWSRTGDCSVTPFWRAPETILQRRQPVAEAAAELRELLEDSVRERLAPSGPTGISLSGGWDSTAVGGTATAVLKGETPKRLRPISISYPQGDPGREDEMIRDVVSHWGISTNWLSVDSIPMVADAAEAARKRDLPFAHAFENWNRALSRRARELGVRVMLDGAGGDQLFQVSSIYLSDLVGQGRFVELARQWAARDRPGFRYLWRWALRPALPAAIPALIARARGMSPPRHYLHRAPPFWFTARFLATHDLVGLDEAAMPPLPGGSRVLGETHAYLRFPFFARIMGTLRHFALEEGVALRSPLMDDRVVRFAARRPWSERADGRETKIVLRRAMAGLLPDHVLAPRTRRTGTTSAYFLRQLRGPGRSLVDSVLQDPLLASLGMIDVIRLRHAWKHVLEHDDDETGARIYFTVQAELWLRSRASTLPTGVA